MILFIDTAFDKTTLALKEDGKIYHEIISEKINISRVIIERTSDLLKKAELKKENIKIIGFNQGPGNFTSLRISLAYIKAIAFHLKVPIVSFNSFQTCQYSPDRTLQNTVFLQESAQLTSTMSREVFIGFMIN